MKTYSMMIRLLLVALLALGLSACGGGKSKPDGGDGFDGSDGADGGDQPAALEVISVSPDHGPPAGGTVVLVSGRGFADGATVSFGANDSQTVNFVSAYQIRATTPPGAAGRVSVIVRNPDGDSASLAQGYEYRDEVGPTIGWCRLQSPASASTTPGAASEPIYGRVYAQGCTDGELHCEAISAQVGHGAPGSDPSAAPEAWTWTDATYNYGHTDDDNDEHQATITEATAGSYAFAYRFSADGGDTWVYCDLDGSDNGFDPAQAGQLTVADQQVEIGWCALQYPAATTTQPDTATEPVFGRVYAAGCTEAEAACGALTGQLGWGDPAVNPSLDPAGWSWTDAGYNPDHADDDNDEHQATITEATAGSYAYAFRFSADGGATWVYCDLDGSDNGFAADQRGALTVDDQSLSVGWCALQSPAATTTDPGVVSEAIWGRVFVAGCSEADQQCNEVQAQVGWGASDVDPTAQPDAWTWSEASYNPGHTGDDNDEYSAGLTVADPGGYAYAYRFSVDAGSTWRYCDLDGSDNGFALAQAGQLTVTGGGQGVDWCNLQFPASTSTAPGVAGEPIFGQVYLAGCTEGAGACLDISAELGYGADGADPASFSWLAASHNPDVTGNNDEFVTSIAPPDEGVFYYAYRFSADGGGSWTVCDLDGSDNGYDAAQAGELTVADRAIGWCNLQHPDATTTGPDTDTELIYGRVYVAGCSDGAATCHGLLAEVGYGAPGVDPSAAPQDYLWFPAAHNPGHTADDNDEYGGALHPMGTGSFSYAYRFSGDGGQTWSYCDLTGSDDGFATADLGGLTVQ